MSAQTAVYDPSTHTVRSKLQLHLLERQANINERSLGQHLFGVAKYLGLGALVHAWFLGAVFDTSNLWSWGYLLAWPVPLTLWVISWILAYLLYGLILGIVCAGVWWGVVEFLDWRARLRWHDAADHLRDR